MRKRLTAAYCPRCSKPQEPGATVCPRCGQDLTQTVPTGGPTSPTAWASQANTLGQPTPGVWPTPATAPSDRTVTFIVIGIVVFIVIMAVLPIIVVLLVLSNVFGSIPEIPALPSDFSTFPPDFPFPTPQR